MTGWGRRAVRRLFVRTYLALAGVILAAVLGVLAWDISLRRPMQEWMRAAAASPEVVRRIYADEADPERASARAGAELGAVVDLVPADAVPPPVRARIDEGLPALPPPGGPPDLWIPLDDGRIARVRPKLPPPPPLALVAAAVLVGLGAAVAWQLRPLDRELERLADAAMAFGAGDLGARVGLPESSPVGELGARFDAMADRIALLVRARQQLLAAVSHELRTPLQRLRFGAELLASADAGERERLAEGIQRDLDALDLLVGELLTWSRLDADPRIAREEVDLRAVLADAADDARRLGATVEVTGAGVITADGRLVRRAVGNLVANAVRYGNGRVRLEAAGDAVHVDDDGPGIPPGDRARALEPFVRLDPARARDEGGVGLGLALVDGIARAHGGSVEIADGVLGGARVSVRFSAPG